MADNQQAEAKPKKGMSPAKQAAYERKVARTAQIVAARERLKAKKYDPRGFDKLSEILLAVKPKPEASNTNGRKFVEKMAKTVRELRKRAYSWDEIADLMTQNNFPITGVELEMCLNPQNFILKKGSRKKKGEEKPVVAEAAGAKPEAATARSNTTPPPLPAEPKQAAAEVSRTEAPTKPSEAAAAVRPPVVPQPVATQTPATASVAPVAPKPSATAEAAAPKPTGILGRFTGAGRS